MLECVQGCWSGPSALEVLTTVIVQVKSDVLPDGSRYRGDELNGPVAAETVQPMPASCASSWNSQRGGNLDVRREFSPADGAAQMPLGPKGKEIMDLYSHS
ncbi:hypothetical protein llap_6781 [Limosa lapponica baueri]|uniref:Uncharacterized protein n=1 Tax=Limosa lapponica baueri TaxID=1758121 RepID=A0A2I0UA64_LIMLA|nr:hypothetical protein llap_6781 [Limosa lapponica baueri]